MNNNDIEKRDHRFKFWLALVGTATLFMLAASALRENVFAEWRTIRGDYAEILREKASDELGRDLANRFQIGMEQYVLPELGRIDRCVTCHPGIDDPRMADQPQPFRTHPGSYLDTHSPAKFGCTICHRGQGRAMSFEEAKGVGHHWDYPLLPASLTQSSCGVCHTAAEVKLAGGEKYAFGQQLFLDKGCQSCHQLNGRGGNMGPALDAVGWKVIATMPMAGIRGERTQPQWLMEHFEDPQRVVDGSQMKGPQLSPDENEALTIYMLSLQGRDLPESYISADKHLEYYQRANPEPLTGEQLYGRFCSTCHSDGSFGRYDKFYKRFMPAIRGFSYVQLATPEYVETNISKGRPGTLMPGWEKAAGGLSKAEISRLREFLLDVNVPEQFRLSEQLVSATNNPDFTFRGDAARGGEIYSQQCSGCHGPTASGPLAPSLKSPAFQTTATDGFIYATIAAGRKNTAMPGFLAMEGAGLNGRDIADLIAYIRQLASAKQ